VEEGEIACEKDKANACADDAKEADHSEVLEEE
jgi:hypothetical protein